MATAVLLLGGAMLLGWAMQWPWLLYPVPGAVAMNPATALCLICAALALLLRHRSPGWAVLAVVAVLVGTIKLVAVLLGTHAYVDSLLFADLLGAGPFSPMPNRMAPNTAMAIALTGMSLLLYRWQQHHSHRAIRAAESLSLVVLLMGVVSLLGYGYQIKEFYGVLNYIPMAPLTALGFVVLSTAMLLAHPEGRLMASLTGPHSGSYALRWLLPFVLFGPAILGFLRIAGYRAGLYSSEFGTLMHVTIEILVLVLLVWKVAVEVNRKDRAKATTEAELADLNARLETVVAERTAQLTEQAKELKSRLRELADYRHAIDQGSIVAITDQKGIIQHVNANFCRISGYSEQELIGQDHRIVNSGHHPPEFIRELWVTIANGRIWKGVLKNRAKDGHFYWVDTTIVPFLNEAGKPDHYLAIRSDITERKLALDSLAESERRFRLALDNMMEGIQIIGHDWRYVYVNDAVTAHARLAADQLLGRTMMECYPGFEHTRVYGLIDRCMKHGESVHFENEFLFASGEVAYFDMSIQPVPEGVFILSVEITVRKKAEQAVLALNASLEQKVAERTAELAQAMAYVTDLYDNAPCGYHSLDGDGRIVNVNSTEAAWLGYTKEELMAMPDISAVLTPESVARYRQLFPEYKRVGVMSDLELDMVRKDGTVLPVLINSTALYDAKGRYTHCRTTVLDNTRLKAAKGHIEALNAELLSNITALDMVNRELESFSYSVSHDLRAPLRAINGFSDMLVSEYGHRMDAESLRKLQVIRDNAINMGRLIDDLLQLSRTGRKEVAMVHTDMTALVGQVLQNLTTTTPHERDRVTIETLPPALCDPQLMMQVWANLISNAIKYSAKRPDPKVRIWADTAPDDITYHISDNGAGFDMAYAHKLFHVFQRLHHKRDFEGTGVGLALVQRIIHKHSGTIRAQAEVDKGATFSFTLPTAPRQDTWN